jgi:F-type H+-transporting ATPase subunit epsilon
MADKKIHISIVTPEESIFEGETGSLIVPASSGGLGILLGHIPLVARLGIGIVKVGIGEGVRYFGVQRGFLEFVFDKANILTERAVETSLEDRDKVVEKLKEKYEIVQEVTEDTKKVAQAVAGLKGLKK